MKQFNQFRKDIDEAVAAVTALPKIVSVASKVAPQIPKFARFASGALKFGTAVPVQVPLGLGVAKVLQSKKDDQSKSSGGPFSPMSDFDASLSRSKYGPGGPQKKDDNKLSNLEIIRQELQRRLQQGPGGKFRRNRSAKFQQTDAELKKKIDQIEKKIKNQKDAK